MCERKIYFPMDAKMVYWKRRSDANEAVEQTDGEKEIPF